MSHFVVVVISDAKLSANQLDETLMPWHEFECTGYEQYIEEVDQTEEARVEFAESGDTSFNKFVEGYYGHTVVAFGQQPDLTKTHKYGHYTVDQKGEVLRVVKRTNPNAKWDWFVVGGRWSGYLGKDEQRFGDLNSAALCDDAGHKAGVRFDHLKRIIGDHPLVKFKDFRDQYPDQLDLARNLYWDTPCMRALSEAREYIGDAELDGLRGSRQQWVDRAKESALTPFAVVKDGKWFERGEMGWWGSVSGEIDQGEWNKQFNALLRETQPEAWLTVVDCHI